MVEPLILYGKEDAVQEITGSVSGIRGADGPYTKGKVGGSNSFYVVYDQSGWERNAFKVSSTSMVIVDGNAVVDFGFAAKSAQGFPKDGITFFKHFWFCGVSYHFTNSNANVMELIRGPSSMIITKGWWTFYKQPNFQGEKMTINGETKFGPGLRMGLPPDFNDRVKSIEYSDTNAQLQFLEQN